MAEKKKTSNTKNKKPSTKGKTQNVSVDAKVIDVAKMESIKEIVLWVMLAICVLLFVSNLGIGGVVGNAISGFFFGVFGIIAYLFPILLLIGVFFGISNSGNRVANVKLVAGIVFVILLSVLVELMAHGGETTGAVQAFYYGKENKAGG